MVWTSFARHGLGARSSFKIDIEYSRTANLGRRLADQALNKAATPTKPDALEKKRTF